MQNSNGFPPNGGVIQGTTGGLGKKALNDNISKTVEDASKVTINY